MEHHVGLVDKDLRIVGKTRFPRGAAAQSILGRHPWQLFIRKDAPRVELAFTRASRRGQRRQVEATAAPRFGGRRVRLVIQPFLSAKKNDNLLHLTFTAYEVPDDVATLTKRKREVCRLIGQGLSTAQIARKLHISLSGVESHRQQIRQKVGLSDNTKLVVWCARYGELF